MLTTQNPFPMICSMFISGYMDGFYHIEITHNERKTSLSYKPEGRILIITGTDDLAEVLKQNEYQIRKILHNKRPKTFFEGFRLKFIIRDNNECIRMNDVTKLVVYDKRTRIPTINTLDYYDCDFRTIYTDGSYNQKQNKCSYVVLFKNQSKCYDIRFGIEDIANSSLIELKAVCEGIRLFEQEEKIRVVTDSRYVIKGLTEWIYNWKLNDWHTAQGNKVKHIEQWIEFDRLTEKKYLEFIWVKAHSFHFENTICDTYAKALLARKYSLNVKNYSFKKGNREQL